MTHAIRIHQTGGPEVMRWEEVDLPAPAAGEATVRHEAVGLNFIDIYHRAGIYPVPLPSGIGMEGAGVVTAVGSGVTDLAVGDRVAYASGPLEPYGAYAEARNTPADRLVKLPDGIDFKTAAAMMLQGMTAQYLLRRTYHPRREGRISDFHDAWNDPGRRRSSDEQPEQHPTSPSIGTPGPRAGIHDHSGARRLRG